MSIELQCLPLLRSPPLLIMKSFCYSPVVVTGLGGRTRWKVHVKWNSHCIMSKKMGMVAFRNSISGTSVISSIGPTISGMNFILWGPTRGKNTFTFKCSAKNTTGFNFSSQYDLWIPTGVILVLKCSLPKECKKNLARDGEQIFFF